MTTKIDLRPRRVLLGLLAAATLTAGCSSGAAGETSTSAQVPTTDSPVAASTGADSDAVVAVPTTAAAAPTTSAVAVTTTVPEIVEAAPATELTSDGVLAAAVIIVSGGDLESAISDGVVTEAEAAAALAALENGTLSDYQD